MQIRLIRSGAIDAEVYLYNHENYTVDGKENEDANRVCRRDFIFMLGSGIAASSASTLIRNNAWAQFYPPQLYPPQTYQNMLLMELVRRATLLAILQQLLLVKDEYRIQEPTSGEFTLINETSRPRRGQLVMAVARQGPLSDVYVEDAATASYELPPESYQTIKFKNGPSGKTPGDKKFVAATQRSRMTESMWVYA